MEYDYYDQLGSAYSDQPDAPELWEIPRFVDEVEQVRKALGLKCDNFYLYGQSCGGLFAIEYALKYPQNLKGLIVSNMMASIPAYNEYARTVLMPAMDPAARKEIQALEAAGDYGNPRYEELLVENYLCPARAAHATRRVAGPGEPGLQAPQPGGLYPDAGAERARRRRQDPALGSYGRPPRDRGVHPDDRCPLWHDGSGIHGEDGARGAAGALLLLPKR
jgi:pimeloyl-ACP methyl ester carboxylesterase